MMFREVNFRVRSDFADVESFFKSYEEVLVWWWWLSHRMSDLLPRISKPRSPYSI